MYDKLMNRYSRIQVIPGKTYICGCDIMANYENWTWSAENPTPPRREKCKVHGQPVAQDSDAKK